MKLVKKHGSTILISLCIGIFLLYMEKPLLLAGDFFIKLLTLVSNNYSEYYYQSVGLNNPDTFSDINNFILILVYSSILIAVNMYFKMQDENFSREVESEILNIETPKEKSQSNKLDEKVNVKEDHQEVVITDTKRLVDEEQSKKKKLLIGLHIVSLFMVIILSYNYAEKKSVSSENLKFRNDLIKIAPYITDSEIKTIQAKWTLMKNKTDYDNINNKIRQLKSKQKIE